MRWRKILHYALRGWLFLKCEGNDMGKWCGFNRGWWSCNENALLLKQIVSYLTKVFFSEHWAQLSLFTRNVINAICIHSCNCWINRATHFQEYNLLCSIGPMHFLDQSSILTQIHISVAQCRKCQYILVQSWMCC